VIAIQVRQPPVIVNILCCGITLRMRHIKLTHCVSTAIVFLHAIINYILPLMLMNFHE